MPKTTFLNLEEEKKIHITKGLIHQFSAHTLDQVTVKGIVEEVGIPRGSFYQYFYDITDAYFYVIDENLIEVHTLFKNLLDKCQGDLGRALELYGQCLCNELFQKDKFALYKNYYLYWNANLDRRRRNCREKQVSNFKGKIEGEILHFISSIVHGLVQRMFTENWNKDTFLDIYKKNIKWIMEGITNDASNGIVL